MSRIERGRVEVGDATDATTLNDTYDDYTAPVLRRLNEFNVRDQAFDLPHLTNVSLVIDTKTALLGNAGLSHTGTPTSVASSTVSPVLHPVQNNAGTETFLDYSAAPLTLEADEVLRVWWNLSVITEFSGSPWDGVSAVGRYFVKDTGVGNVVLSDGMHCWIVYLQWDITSAALTNWEPVPGQETPGTTYGSEEGIALPNMAASSVISPWVITSFGFGDAGEMPGGNTGQGRDHGWHANYSMWAHSPASQKTVYGVRLVISGLLHPAHLSTGDEENLLVYDYNVSATLKYLGGRITGMQMRMG